MGWQLYSSPQSILPHANTHRPGQVEHLKLYYVLIPRVPPIPREFPISRRSRVLKVVFPLCLICLILAGCEQRAATSPARPPEVSVETVIRKDVTLTSDWVATLDGYVNARIQAQVAAT